MNDCDIGFIGGGNMARSIIGGLRAAGGGATIAVAEPDAGRRESLAHDFGVSVTKDNAAVAAHAASLIFAVKPQAMAAVCREAAAACRKRRPLVLSIAAGIRVGDMRRWLDGGGDAESDGGGVKNGDSGLAIVRAMPNTPALVRCGASALFASEACGAAERRRAGEILRAVGTVCWVEEERLLDAVTALSGSGPAYFFSMMEAMCDAAAAAGLAPDTARALTLQTARGAAALAADEKISFAELRRRVTSPGGTTEEALGILRERGFTDAVTDAVHGAARRAGELAAEFGA
ncbi:MAG: pyrroline-5-carboxylate reductase [Gammaproteobacteria bacterium]|nr:pyrroline-5-carboxylate reductase [Gammaproteobacteria bacterium]